MKLSNDTREVLKNFSTINQNLLVKNGTVIGTMSAMKNIVAKATVPDTFNNEFAIYDLNEFLSAMSLFKDPTLTFDEKSVKLNEEGGGSKLTYMFSDPSIVTAPKTEITMPSVDVEFTFTQDTFNQILKASAAKYLIELPPSEIVTCLSANSRSGSSNNDIAPKNSFKS